MAAARRCLVFGLLALVAATAQAAGNSYRGSSIFCCENEAGQRVCGDTLPQVCYGRAYRRIASDGTVIERVAAPMTAEERAEAARTERLKELEEARRRSQRLQDRALLDTYRDLSDIDTRERRAVDDIQRDLDKADRRMAELKKDAERLQEESKLHPSGDMPVDLQQAINDNLSEQSAQQTVIEAKRKNIEAVRARFARDRDRYRVLTETAPAGR
jgi:DNA repair exonuclease SbcCD ATPase subunit